MGYFQLAFGKLMIQPIAFYKTGNYLKSTIYITTEGTKTTEKIWLAKFFSHFRVFSAFCGY